LVDIGDFVEAEQSLATFDPFSEPILAEMDGTVHFEDIDKNTIKEEVNEDTGRIEKKVADSTVESLQPRIVLRSPDGEDLITYYLPGGAYLNVDDGEKIKAGKSLAKILKESVKTSDITGGLPRVGELFEARRPKVTAVLAPVAGTVRFKGITKSKREIAIEDLHQKEHKVMVPMGRHLLVREGDLIQAGEPLCDGSPDPP